MVQEIIEQLWTCYVMKYGENDAKKAEKSFFSFRKEGHTSPSPTPSGGSRLNVPGEDSKVADAKRKYLKQFSDAGTELLRTTSVLEAMKTTTQEPKQQV